MRIWAALRALVQGVGPKTCDACTKPIPDGGDNFCSDACAEDWLARTY